MPGINLGLQHAEHVLQPFKFSLQSLKLTNRLSRDFTNWVHLADFKSFYHTNLTLPYMNSSMLYLNNFSHIFFHIFIFALDLHIEYNLIPNCSFLSYLQRKPDMTLFLGSSPSSKISKRCFTYFYTTLDFSKVPCLLYFYIPLGYNLRELSIAHCCFESCSVLKITSGRIQDHMLCLGST